MTDPADEAHRFACPDCEVAWSWIGPLVTAARSCWVCGGDGVESSVLLAGLVSSRDPRWVSYALATGQIPG